jgi:hypothetical protein
VSLSGPDGDNEDEASLEGSDEDDEDEASLEGSDDDGEDDEDNEYTYHPRILQRDAKYVNFI